MNVDDLSSAATGAKLLSWLPMVWNMGMPPLLLVRMALRMGTMLVVVLRVPSVYTMSPSVTP